MSPDATGGLRALAFGTLDGSVWGAALDADPAGPVALVLGGAQDGVGVVDGLRWDDGWRLIGDGVDLRVEPTAGDDAPSQLCRVSGTVSLAGAAHDVDCVGTRSVLEPGRLASARLMSAWFGDNEALLLTALRADAGARAHHDADRVAATLFDPDGPVPVTDPRLSTTYDKAGAPTRASLELWVGEGENEHPRRAAGEAAGPGVTATAGRLALRACSFRCHSRGHEGAGVYALASFSA